MSKLFPTYSLKQTSAATVEPLTLAEAKAHLRVDHDDENTLIEGLIKSAREQVELITRRRLITATYRIKLDGFPCRIIHLPLPPLQSVSSVTYVDANGDTQTLDASAYQVDAEGEPGRLAPAPGSSGWPSTQCGKLSSVAITFVAGYGAAGTDVPGSALQAMRLLIGHWNEHREEVPEEGVQMERLPMGVAALLSTLDWGSQY